MGMDIYGATSAEQFGQTVSMSSDGQTVAIGAPTNSTNGANAGQVRVYEWQDSMWVQKGITLNGTDAGNQAGYAVSLSADGHTLAMGAPYSSGNIGFETNTGKVRVFEWNGTDWVQKGSNIYGNELYEESGRAVSLSADGNWVAIGSPETDAYTTSGYATSAGKVRIFKWNGSDWEQKGSSIYGDAEFDRLGMTVSLSTDGHTVAMGAPYNDGNGLDAGQIRVYDWDGNDWVQKGSDLPGDSTFKRAGHAVSLSADGNLLAVGAPASTNYSGLVRMFEWDGNDWVQKGGDIPGAAAQDQSGHALSLSADGLTVVIGSPYSDENGISSGQVRVYAWSGSDWMQKGSNVDGESGGIASGYSVALNADGSTMVIGAPHANPGNSGRARVYAWDGSDWVPKGNDLDGASAGEKLGFSVSLSADGQSLAIGSPFGSKDGLVTGKVRVFSWIGIWVQKGSDIDGEAEGDFFGGSVSLSNDGNTVAIGGSKNDGNGTDAGQVRVYKWSGTDWVQKGSEINGEAEKDYSGRAVALNSHGDMVAIGATGNDGNGDRAGHVRVYKWSGTDWVQRGSDIDGEAEKEYSGHAVALSANGDILAIGVPGSAVNGTFSGQVRVFEWNGSDWVQKGQGIDGEAIGDLAGYSVALSADGHTLAVGIPKNDGPGLNAGQVRIFEWDGNSWVLKGQAINGEKSNYLGRAVALSADGHTVAAGMPFYSTDFVPWTGRVGVYEWNGSTWVQKGDYFQGEGTNDRFGSAVALSANGNIIAMGAPYNNTNGNLSGQVRVYSYPVGTIELTPGTNLNASPNPNSGTFSIALGAKYNKVDVNIRDICGRTVFHEAYKQTDKIDISLDVPSGQYILTIRSEDRLMSLMIVRE